MVAEEELVDAEIERVDVAVKAVWLLYRRGKYKLLEAIGLSQNRVLELFRAFDSFYMVFDHGRLMRESHVFDFLEFAGPDVVDVAVFLLHMLWLIPEIEYQIAEVLVDDE